MPEHSHRFVEEYTGLVGMGLDRQTDEATLIVYLQKFADDDLMAVLRSRITDEDMEDVFNLISRLLKKHLSEEEYHRLFLKENHDG